VTMLIAVYARAMAGIRLSYALAGSRRFSYSATLG
jgi:hypothetical protein